MARYELAQPGHQLRGDQDHVGLGPLEVLDVGRVVDLDDGFVVLAVLYFVLTYPQSLAVNALYRRFRMQE